MTDNLAFKSYTMLSVSGGILDNVLRAVQSAKEDAMSKKETQVIDVFSRGHRSDILWGKILVIPPQIMDGEYSAIPSSLTRGAVAREFFGDDLADFEIHRLAESEFDVIDDAKIKTFKEKVFKSPDGKMVPIIVFQPAWAYANDFTMVRWIQDEVRLRDLIRHLCFSAYYSPSNSQLLDALVVTEDQISVDHLNRGGLDKAFGWHPNIEEGGDPCLSGSPILEKRASKRRKVCASLGNLKTILAELGADGQEAEESEFFDKMGDQIAQSLAQNASLKRAGEGWMLPGQVLREFYPDIEQELLKYPNQNNSGMPESKSDISDVPASGSLTPKPSILQETVPLRRELQLRGPGFMNDFYRSVVNIQPNRLQMASQMAAKLAAEVAVEVDMSVPSKQELLSILQGVCGEIVATLLAAFRVTQKPMAEGIPGEGSISLNPDIMGDVGSSIQADRLLAERVRTLATKLNDGDLQSIINDSWAQGAVWCDGDEKGFTYEVLVRAESFDDQAMTLKYKYVVRTK